MTNFTSAEYNQDFIFTKEFLLVSVIINIVLYTPFLLNKKYNINYKNKLATSGRSKGHL